MTKIELRSHMTVDLIDHMGNDDSIVRAARTSLGDAPADPDRTEGLINYLMRERHGVPFESVVATFRIECPIFVSRQLVKHRLSSINEVSGRYVELAPVFWVPDANRPLKNGGTSASPAMVPHPEQSKLVEGMEFDLSLTYQDLWDVYEFYLEKGVANEVARTVLPVSLYTTMYMTANLRSWFNFLNLRLGSFGSHPQKEIEEVAIKINNHLFDIAPTAMNKFHEHEGVAP